MTNLPPRLNHNALKGRRILLPFLMLVPLFFVGTQVYSIMQNSESAGGHIPWPLIAAIGGFGIFFVISMVFTIMRIRGGTETLSESAPAVNVQEPERFSESDPNAPWLQNSEWKTGRIECSNHAAMLAFWIISVIVLGISVGVNWDMLTTLVSTGEFYFTPALFVPLAGLCAVGVAIYLTLRWKKFGASVFELKNRTGRVGGTLAGTLRCTRDIQTTGEYSLLLTCTETITAGSGKNRSTKSYKRWEQTVKLPGNAYSARSGIPVSISIPADCLATNDHRAAGTVAWALKISAPTAGVDYAADFAVPVFHVGTSQ